MLWLPAGVCYGGMVYFKKLCPVYKKMINWDCKAVMKIEKERPPDATNIKKKIILYCCGKG